MNSSSETELRRKRKRSPSLSSSSSSSSSLSKSKSKKHLSRKDKHRHRSRSKEKLRNRSKSRSRSHSRSRSRSRLRSRDRSESRSRNRSKSRSHRGHNKKKRKDKDKDKESKHSHKHDRRKDKKTKESKSKSDRKEKKKEKEKESRKDSKKESKNSSIQDSPKSIQNTLALNSHFLYPMGDKNNYMRPPPFQYQFRKQIPQPMEIPNMHPIQSMSDIPKMDISTEGPTDKIVKDQNFLNSDEKLFETIVNHEMNLRSVFANCQISEYYLGSTLYKTIKKTIYDPNITIFDDKESGKESQQTMPQEIEFVQKKIENIRHKANRMNYGDMSEIIAKVNLLKEAESKGVNISSSNATVTANAQQSGFYSNPVQANE